MNKCILKAWDAQPIHCPFCGKALQSYEQVSCKHLLYIISSGNYVSRTDRYDKLLGLAPGTGEAYPEFSAEERTRLGDPHNAACKVLEKLPAGLEFEIYGPTDSTFIGFAALDDELCGWGVAHKSPYEPEW